MANVQICAEYMEYKFYLIDRIAENKSCNCIVNVISYGMKALVFFTNKYFNTQTIYCLDIFFLL